MNTWERHIPRTAVTRVIETGCCGAFEWAAEGGQYLILRPAEHGYEETARGGHAAARAVWNELVLAHRQRHRAVRTAATAERHLSTGSS